MVYSLRAITVFSSKLHAVEQMAAVESVEGTIDKEVADGLWLLYVPVLPDVSIPSFGTTSIRIKNIL